MAKKSRKTRRSHLRVPPLFERINIRIFGIALEFIVLGYLCMLQAPVNGVWSRSVAPLLLVPGYGIIMPLAILWRGKRAPS